MQALSDHEIQMGSFAFLGLFFQQPQMLSESLYENGLYTI